MIAEGIVSKIERVLKGREEVLGLERADSYRRCLKYSEKEELWTRNLLPSLRT